MSSFAATLCTNGVLTDFCHTGGSDAEPWFLARLARLPVVPSARCHVGLYACCPMGEGGHAVFAAFEVRPPREGEVTLHG